MLAEIIEREATVPTTTSASTASEGTKGVFAVGSIRRNHTTAWGIGTQTANDTVCSPYRLRFPALQRQQQPQQRDAVAKRAATRNLEHAQNDGLQTRLSALHGCPAPWRDSP